MCRRGAALAEAKVLAADTAGPDTCSRGAAPLLTRVNVSEVETNRKRILKVSPRIDVDRRHVNEDESKKDDAPLGSAASLR